MCKKCWQQHERSSANLCLCKCHKSIKQDVNMVLITATNINTGDVGLFIKMDKDGITARENLIEYKGIKEGDLVLYHGNNHEKFIPEVCFATEYYVISKIEEL